MRIKSGTVTFTNCNIYSNLSIYVSALAPFGSSNVGIVQLTLLCLSHLRLRNWQGSVRWLAVERLLHIGLTISALIAGRWRYNLQRSSDVHQL